MHPSGQGDGRVGQVARLAHDVHRLATNRRQKYLNITAGYELRVHATGFLEKHPSQLSLGTAKALSNARQIPDRLNGRLGHHACTRFFKNDPVGLETALRNGFPHLG